MTPHTKVTRAQSIKLAYERADKIGERAVEYETIIWEESDRKNFRAERVLDAACNLETAHREYAEALEKYDR